MAKALGYGSHVYEQWPSGIGDKRLCSTHHGNEANRPILDEQASIAIPIYLHRCEDRTAKARRRTFSKLGSLLVRLTSFKRTSQVPAKTDYGVCDVRTPVYVRSRLNEEMQMGLAPCDI